MKKITILCIILSSLFLVISCAQVTSNTRNHTNALKYKLNQIQNIDKDIKKISVELNTEGREVVASVKSRAVVTNLNGIANRMEQFFDRIYEELRITVRSIEKNKNELKKIKSQLNPLKVEHSDLYSQTEKAIEDLDHQKIELYDDMEFLLDGYREAKDWVDDGINTVAGWLPPILDLPAKFILKRITNRILYPYKNFVRRVNRLFGYPTRRD